MSLLVCVLLSARPGVPDVDEIGPVRRCEIAGTCYDFTISARPSDWAWEDGRDRGVAYLIITLTVANCGERPGTVFLPPRLTAGPNSSSDFGDLRDYPWLLLGQTSDADRPLLLYRDHVGSGVGRPGLIGGVMSEGRTRFPSDLDWQDVSAGGVVQRDFFIQRGWLREQLDQMGADSPAKVLHVQCAVGGMLLMPPGLDRAVDDDPSDGYHNREGDLWPKEALTNEPIGRSNVLSLYLDADDHIVMSLEPPAAETEDEKPAGE